ncbi:MAG: hypothetical protein ACI9MR_000630 [Myxococcota bacterium]|jgi:hypothetical protein
MRHREHFIESNESSPSKSGEDLGGVAVFFDVENILLGVQGEFAVQPILSFLADRGEVMVMRGYADWGRYKAQQRQFLEEGVQMVFLPSYGVSDKNRTDTAICVDAMETMFTRPHIDTYCIVSGDSDFGVLAQRLRDYGKRIVGISAKNAASRILVKQCHEFVFYETLVGQRVQGYSVEEGETRLTGALDKVVEEHGAEFRASVLKDRMRKQDPTFSERNYGASSFTRFLRNYEHLVTVLDGGKVRAGKPAEEPQGHVLKGPKLTKAVVTEARGILTRSIIEATGKGTPVPLSRLKDTMQTVAPEFDELSLGYKTFTRFLLAFSDVILVDRANNTASAAEGIAPELDGAGVGGGEQRRRGRGKGASRRNILPTVDASPESV